MKGQPVQQPLPNIGLRDEATFQNFVGASKAVSFLLGQGEGIDPDLRLIYLWGERYTGRSHLLQAACHQCRQGGGEAFYLPLANRAGLNSGILQSMATMDQICIDDLDEIGQDRSWEEAVFHFLNDARDSGKRVLVAANQPPQGLNLMLADVQSRLSSALVLKISPLSDEEKERAVRSRAENRGLDLGDEVIRYIMTRSFRDMGSLYAVLEELDRETVAQQRRVTIPFVKKVLDL